MKNEEDNLMQRVCANKRERQRTKVGTMPCTFFYLIELPSLQMYGISKDAMICCLENKKGVVDKIIKLIFSNYAFCLRESNLNILLN